MREAELDLFLLTQGRKLGVECKSVDAPRLTPSMKTAVEELQLDPLAVIYPGSRPYPRADHITLVPLKVLAAQGEAALFPA